MTCLINVLLGAESEARSLHALRFPSKDACELVN